MKLNNKLIVIFSASIVVTIVLIGALNNTIGFANLLHMQ